MLSRGQLKVCLNFFGGLEWNYLNLTYFVINLPEFSWFFLAFARISMVFQNWRGSPPLSRTPMGVNSRAELVPSPRAYARKGALGDDCFLCWCRQEFEEILEEIFARVKIPACSLQYWIELVNPKCYITHVLYSKIFLSVVEAFT